MSIDTELTNTDTDTSTTPDEPVLETIGGPPAAPERVVEVRRRPGVCAALGAGAALVALAYLARAASNGAVLDWVLGVGLGLVGVVNLALLVDARLPLLVADDLGVRLRLGRTWVGLPWGGLHEVEHRSRSGWWRDGLLTVRTHYVQRILEDLDPGARRMARLNRRLYHSPLAVPLGLGTRVVGAHPDLTSALRELADARTPVVDSSALLDHSPVDDGPIDDSLIDDGPLVEDLQEARRPRRLPDPRPALAHLIGEVAARFERPARAEVEEVAEVDLPYVATEIVPSATPTPVREAVAAARAEVHHEARVNVDEVAADDTQVWDGLHAVPEVDGPLVIADEVADELADRTRIRPHVIEAIEIDDFGACGGDFYARGHLRTLARVLGVEGAPVLAAYDEQYADAPIDPRAVFEAELAGAGSIRATRGGPNWSVLVAAVMALVLCWSVARLVTGGPDANPDRAVLSGSGGPNHSRSVLSKPVPVVLTAAGGGARVVVRDGLGKLVYAGDLAYGQKHTVEASPPVRIQSTDGAVQVTVDGQDRGRMGPAGRPTSRSYAGAR